MKKRVRCNKSVAIDSAVHEMIDQLSEKYKMREWEVVEKAIYDLIIKEYGSEEDYKEAIGDMKNWPGCPMQRPRG